MATQQITDVTITETSTEPPTEPPTESPIVKSNELVDNINALSKYIKSTYGNRITPANIVLIASELIQIAEKYKTFTGLQKKMLVVNTIKQCINEQNLDSDDKTALNIIVDFTLPSIVDGFVSAINGMYSFSKKVKNSKFCGCLKKSK
jgi:hypothetical protein